MADTKAVSIDVATLYEGNAKINQLPTYEAAVRAAVPPGARVTLTGVGPIWLYLRLARALHGRASALFYESPVTGPVEIFENDPF